MACSGSYWLNGTTCDAWTECTLGTTCMTQTPSNTQDRSCSAVNTCSFSSGQYMRVAPTLLLGECGMCASHTPCNSSQYESVEETPTSDRSCSLRQCLDCANGNMATGAACTDGAGGRGTICTSCHANFYLDAGQCKPHTDCDSLGLVESAPGDGTNNAPTRLTYSLWVSLMDGPDAEQQKAGMPRAACPKMVGEWDVKQESQITGDERTLARAQITIRAKLSVPQVRTSLLTTPCASLLTTPWPPSGCAGALELSALAADCSVRRVGDR